MAAEAGPPGKARVLRVDVSTSEGLSHSNIYESEEVIAAIVRHIKGENPATPRRL